MGVDAASDSPDGGSLPADAAAVLRFWFGRPGDPGHGEPRSLWFKKEAATDREILTRFGPLIEHALRGELDGWSTAPPADLARIVLLDQFTRNAFRGTARAFAGDVRALAAARAMVGSQLDMRLPPLQRAFAYLPFEHAESLTAQDDAVRLFTRLADEQPALASMLDYAHRHRDVIARFGRFPHRNAALGRRSTEEEAVYLETPGSRF